MKKIILVIAMISLVAGLALPATAVFLQIKDQAKVEQAEPVAKTPASAVFPIKTFKLKYANAKELGETLKGLLAEAEVLSVNERLNAIVVRASERTINRISSAIENLDKAPLQVMVEAKIIELRGGTGDTNDPSVLGFSWKYEKNANNYIEFNSTNTATAAASSLGLYAQLISGNIEAYLNTLEKTVGYDIVASPWVMALNHEPAYILIGSKYGYKTSIISQTSTVQEIRFLEVGTKLNFTPHINEEGFIIMDLYPAISDGAVKNDLPQEDTTETRNRVLVKDGQSVVIGGLTKKFDREVVIGLPILSSIPFLGNLFRRTEIQSEKREVMVIVTPRIVTPAFLQEASDQAADLDARRQEWSEKAKILRR